MKFRIADLSDIAQMQVVRHLVKENTLSDPNLVPDKDVVYYITEKGKGWVAETGGKIVGFSIVDLQDKSVWALFVDPVHAEKGVGKELHRLMIDGTSAGPMTPLYWAPLPIPALKDFMRFRVGKMLEATPMVKLNLN